MLNDLEQLLESAVKDTGVELSNTTAEVAQYTLQRSEFLATVVGQPGYQLAVIAERDNVALFAGLNFVAKADAAQQRFIGVIQGALAIAATAITKGAI